MTTLTDKEMIKEIKERIGSLDVRDNIERRAYEIALASLEAEPVAWRYRYVKKGVTDSQGEPWVGDWKYVPTKEDCNDRPNYEIQELYNLPPAIAAPTRGLVNAVRFYDQVKHTNPPVETGAWKDAIDWVLKEACLAVNIGISDAEITAAMEDKLKINMERQWPEPKDGEPRLHIKEPGNSPVTPDGWISCSERMPAQDDWILIYSKHGEYMAGQVQGEYVELSDGTLSWLGNALFWMPLPEPPQEVK
ncbi:TPA: DUF550 domain-containing protein [Escherichia coli]|nr:DUF550 domain-containing protein [Escherichia coli]